jgi:hypothetical protein
MPSCFGGWELPPCPGCFVRRPSIFYVCSLLAYGPAWNATAVRVHGEPGRGGDCSEYLCHLLESYWIHGAHRSDVSYIKQVLVDGVPYAEALKNQR